MAAVRSVRRRYWVALSLGVLIGLGALLLSAGSGTPSNGLPPPPSAADQAASRALISRLKLPANFSRVDSFGPGKPCKGDRCYLVPQPTTVVARLVPGLLRSVASYRPTLSSCTKVHPGGHGTALICTFVAMRSSTVGIIASADPHVACTASTKCRWTEDTEFILDD